MAEGRLRIVVATHFPRDPDDPCGGVESVSVHLVRALAKYDDLDIHVVTFSPDCKLPSESTCHGATIHRLPRGGGSMLRHAVGAGRRQLREFVETLKPDVVHAHDTYGLMVKGMPIPRVFTVHGFIYADTLVKGGVSAWARSLVWWWVETAGWADQPHIISISPYVRERLTGRVSGILHDIDNPVSDTFFQIKRQESKQRIYCAAAICRRKNTLGLLAGFARLLDGGGNAELRLSGSSPETAYAEQVRRFIDDHGLQAKVKLLGRIGYDSVYEELAAASVFALVSYEENSPMGIEEAMAAGVPVVTSNRCGMPYMVRDGETGFLVDPDNADDIAWCLRQLLEDDGLRARMGAKAKQVAEDRFHPQRVAERTREVYLRAARDCRRNPAHG